MVNKSLPLLDNDATLLSNNCKTYTILPIIYSILLINAEIFFTEHVKTKEKHIKIASNCYYGIWLRLVEFLIRYKWILPGLIYYLINTMLFIIYDVVYTEQLIENHQRETKAFI